MENMNVLFLVVVIIGVLSIMVIEYNKKRNYELVFNKAFDEFNFDRINPISKESFKQYFRFNYMVDPFSRTFSSYRDSNHRNGDELIENTHRNAKERIISHLGIHSKKRAINSLGYNFKSLDNLHSFIYLLHECTDEGTQLSFPINNEWFVFERMKDSFNVSCKKNLLLSKERQKVLL